MELDLVTTVLLLVGLLFAASLISLVANRIRFPYTVLLVVFGMGVRLVFSEWEGFGFLESEISTEVVFFIFLPTLLFESSFNLDSKILFRNIVPILTLAIPAFLLSTAIVGFLGSWALGLPLATALLFGALISATDPVAVVALFKELGAPKRLMVLVEGESLLNDATAIVCSSGSCSASPLEQWRAYRSLQLWAASFLSFWGGSLSARFWHSHSPRSFRSFETTNSSRSLSRPSSLTCRSSSLSTTFMCRE